MAWTFFSKVRTHRCPDGSTRTVYKSLDDAFPLFIPGWNGNIAAGAHGNNLVTADVKAEYATKIQGLLFGLDELNNSLMFDFRAAYITYTIDPCANSDFLARQVERILGEQTQFQRLRLQVQALVTLAASDHSDPERIMDLFQRRVDQLGQPIAEAAVAEISDNRERMKKMIKDKRER